ncbi:MAG: hypothetical protein RL448_22 [Actinomycetota bacterium]|jgi:hypothetical protein
MSSDITIVGFLLIAILIFSSNFYAYRNPKRLSPLGYLVTKLMADRSTRIALVAFWWWVGYHFLYSNL